MSHPPLNPELGAAQTALNLAEALRARGHHAVAWSPEPLPADICWWELRRRQRRAIEAFVTTAGPFDVVDTPAISASRTLGRSSFLVVRSIQPELLYLLHTFRDEMRRPTPRAMVHAVFSSRDAGAILGGWRRARRILCLGSRELDWMRRRFPLWAPKLGHYLSSPEPAERAAFAEVRARRSRLRSTPVRYLWIGRWATHKGTRILRHYLEQRASASNAIVTVAGCGAGAAREIPDAWLRSGRVRLVPRFSRAELPALLAEHDAGLFTSTVEGWGLSLSEMLESGLVVFATDVGGVRDLRPYFPDSLRSFPPPCEPELDAIPLEDLEMNGYYERFSWPAIAREYEQQVLRPAEAVP